MGWPQIIYLALILYSIFEAASHHGEQRTGRHNLWATLVSAALSVGLVYWGGFFG